MRISDWSSDACSSDLPAPAVRRPPRRNWRRRRRRSRWGRPCATCRARRWPWVLRLRRQPRGCRTSRFADLRTEYVCSPRVSGAPDITLVRLVPVFWHVIVFMPTTDQHGESLSMAQVKQQDYSFPKGLLWGAATAAHQIEGSRSDERRIGKECVSTCR